MSPDNLKDIRKGLGLTQSQMAEALALGRNGRRTIRRYETGEMTPSGPVLLLYENYRAGRIVPPANQEERS